MTPQTQTESKAAKIFGTRRKCKKYINLLNKKIANRIMYLEVLTLKQLLEKNFYEPQINQKINLIVDKSVLRPSNLNLS